jgi:hypothetical protein
MAGAARLIRSQCEPAPQGRSLTRRPSTSSGESPTRPSRDAKAHG